MAVLLSQAAFGNNKNKGNNEARPQASYGRPPISQDKRQEIKSQKKKKTNQKEKK